MNIKPDYKLRLFMEESDLWLYSGVVRYTSRNNITELLLSTGPINCEITEDMKKALRRARTLQVYNLIVGTGATLIFSDNFPGIMKGLEHLAKRFWGSG